MWVRYSDDLWINMDQVAQIGIKADKQKEDKSYIFVIYHNDVKSTTIDSGTQVDMEYRLQNMFKMIEKSKSDKFVDVRNK